jgi:hypothetical protein
MMIEANAERFRNEAHECQQMAAKAMSQPDKEAWLKLAADWIKLAEDTERPLRL